MIRPATSKDVAAMACFAAGWSARQIEAQLHEPLARVLVAEVGGRVVGHAIGWAVAGEVQIHEVAVALDARRHGLGSKLVEALVETCGGGQALLELRASNKPALALYEATGFEVVGRRPNYYPDGEDALLMTRPG